jgi:hypothetical protein
MRSSAIPQLTNHLVSFEGSKARKMLLLRPSHARSFIPLIGLKRSEGLLKQADAYMELAANNLADLKQGQADLKQAQEEKEVKALAIFDDLKEMKATDDAKDDKDLKDFRAFLMKTITVSTFGTTVTTPMSTPSRKTKTVSIFDSPAVLPPVFEDSAASPIVQKMPAIKKTVTKNAGLFVCSNLGGGVPKWERMSPKNLPAILAENAVKGVAQVNDCSCLLLDNGKVLPAVYHVGGWTSGYAAKFSREFLSFGEGSVIESIQACGPNLVATATDGLRYMTTYQLKGRFDTPKVITTDIDVFGIGPASLFGFISSDLQDSDVKASLQIIPMDSLFGTAEENGAESVAGPLPTTRVRAKIAYGNDGCLLLAYDTVGAGLVYRLKENTFGKSLSMVRVTVGCCGSPHCLPLTSVDFPLAR